VKASQRRADGLWRVTADLYLTDEERELWERSGPRFTLAPGDDLFTVRYDDGDTELACAGCGARVCYIDNGDDLATLARLAADHRCTTT
jgi:hypothetical protein